MPNSISRLGAETGPNAIANAGPALELARQELVGPLADVVGEMTREEGRRQGYPLETHISLEHAWFRVRDRISPGAREALEAEGAAHRGGWPIPSFDYLYSSAFLPMLYGRIAVALPPEVELASFNLFGSPISSVYVSVRER